MPPGEAALDWMVAQGYRNQVGGAEQQSSWGEVKSRNICTADWGKLQQARFRQDHGRAAECGKLHF